MATRNDQTLGRTRGRVQLEPGGATPAQISASLDQVNDVADEITGQTGLSAVAMATRNTFRTLVQRLHRVLERMLRIIAVLERSVGDAARGPSSSTDNAVPRWDGASGRQLQDSLMTISDNGQSVVFGNNSLSGVVLNLTGATGTGGTGGLAMGGPLFYGRGDDAVLPSPRLGFHWEDGSLNELAHLDYDGILRLSGGLVLKEQSADPDDPAEGEAVIWMGDGTGTGGAGDVLLKVTSGGVTKTVAWLDFSRIP